MKSPYQKMALRHSVEIQCLHQECNVTIPELVRRFPQYSRASIYRQSTIPINDEPRVDLRQMNRGRPRLISSRGSRRVIHEIARQRKQVGSFTSKRVHTASGFTKVSNRTVRRTLNRADYGYLRTRREGVLTAEDVKARLKWARRIRRNWPDGSEPLWKEGICFYLDGTGFVYKTNPFDEATSPKAREWRLPGEALSRGCTSKGAKEGKKQLRFMVCMSYGKGVIKCVRYAGRINSEKFTHFLNAHLDDAISKSCNPKARRLLMDGCPVQNSKTSRAVLDNLNVKVVEIPARSPDVNPIENLFNLVGVALKEQTIAQQITRETEEEFEKRVVDLLMLFPAERIDKIVDTMSGRIDLIIKSRGQRIRY